MLGFIIGLCVAFQVKHFVCDYPLQTVYMLGKFKPGWDFVGPLAAHAGVHAVATGIIAAFVVGVADLPVWLVPLCAGIDFVTHFCIDRVKASPNLLGRFNDKMKASYWNCLGADQWAHHMVHYGIVYLLVSRIAS